MISKQNLDETLESPPNNDNIEIQEEGIVCDPDYIESFSKYSCSLNSVLFLFGILINLASFVYNSSAAENSRFFNKKDYLGLYQVSMEILSFGIRLINPYLLSIRHKTKMIISVTCAFVGLVIGGASRYMNDDIIGFSMSLVGISLVGLNMAFSECIIFGFLKAAPSKFVSPVIGGTGFAGVPAVILRLLLIRLGVGFSELCFGLAPLYLLQIAAFFYTQQTVISLRQNHMDIKGIPHIPLEEEEAATNHNMNIKDLITVLRNIGYECINITTVFYMEYMCLTSFADKSNPHHHNESGNFINDNFFLILHLSYHTGALLSRGSVLVLRFKYVGVTTILQLVNFIVYFSTAYTKWMPSLYQIPFMLYIGLLGGLNYGNGIMAIMESKKLNRHVRELAVSVVEISYVTGIIIAGLSAVGVSKFLIPE